MRRISVPQPRMPDISELSGIEGHELKPVQRLLRAAGLTAVRIQPPACPEGTRRPMELHVSAGARKVATVVIGQRSRIFVVSFSPPGTGVRFTKPGDYRSVRDMIFLEL